MAFSPLASLLRQPRVRHTVPPGEDRPGQGLAGKRRVFHGPEGVVVMSQPVTAKGWTHEPEESVRASFATNTIVIERNGVRYEVRPGESIEHGEHAVSIDGYVISSVLGPVTTVWERALGDQQWLIEDFEHHWLRAAASWLVDVNRQWVEPAVFVDSLLHDVEVGDFHSRFFDYCRRRGIRFAIRVVGANFAVISATDGEVLSSQQCAVVPVSGGCALNAGADICTMHGGPWTSKSRSAAGAWFGNRSRLVQALGCAACSGERYVLGDEVFTGNPIISITEPSVPTRWLTAAEA